jgi:hypothetical protein
MARSTLSAPRAKYPDQYKCEYLRVDRDCIQRKHVQLPAHARKIAVKARLSS